MAETNKDRIHIQVEKIHDMDKMLKIKPTMTLQEYRDMEYELLEKLEAKKS